MEKLSAGERDVVLRALAGASNSAIAAARRCAPRTVANLLARAYDKLGVASRRELAAKLALTRGELIAELRSAACARLGAVVHDGLATRERQAIELLLHGASNKVIASELGVASSTVAGVLASACRKVGVGSTLELLRVVRAVRESGTSHR